MSEPFFLEVIGRRILVKPDRFEHKGLIAIPETAQRKGTTGRIVLIGKTTEDDAVHGLKPGDRILYDRFSGGEIGFEAEGIRSAILDTSAMMRCCSKLTMKAQ